MAISLRSIVLPVLGWATIKPRWPFPIGVNKSIQRVEIDSFEWPVSFSFSSGCNGVKNWNGTLSLIAEEGRPLTLSTFMSGKYFSPSLGGRIAPFTLSPVLRPNNFIWLWDTYISSGEAW